MKKKKKITKNKKAKLKNQEHNSASNVVLSFVRHLNNSYPHKNIYFFVQLSLLLIHLPSSFFLNSLPPLHALFTSVCASPGTRWLTWTQPRLVKHEHMITVQQEAHNYAAHHFGISNCHT